MFNPLIYIRSHYRTAKGAQTARHYLINSHIESSSANPAVLDQHLAALAAPSARFRALR